ncbi:MAG: alpha/beta fold hydrolase [Candidatus Hydrogenedentes bacterium]|nr:alpha/beta fold hydrolase [Candidatus Hydrogenedentota bacterium]
MNLPDYPFVGKPFNIDGVKMNYLDEGVGDPVVMVHGNPSWSYYYRHLVLALRGTHRCIVPDHIGCGYSDKPGDDRYDYTLERRVDNLEALLDHCGVEGRITLVVHDWGGMIGLAFAMRKPERIKRLVVLNTSAFLLPDTKPFPWPLWIVRNTLAGTLMVRGFNAFSRIAATVCCTRNPMPKPVRDAYCSPYNSWDNRIATLRFVQDIPLRPGDRSYAIVKHVQENVQQLTGVPMLVCWGLRDFVFDKHFLALWEKHFPNAEFHRFDDCGHYILEDARDEVIPLIEKFLDAHPLT